MKKVLILAITIVAVLVLVGGCTGKKETSGSSTITPEILAGTWVADDFGTLYGRTYKFKSDGTGIFRYYGDLDSGPKPFKWTISGNEVSAQMVYEDWGETFTYQGNNQLKAGGETWVKLGEVAAYGGPIDEETPNTEQETPLILEDIDLAKLFAREKNFFGGLGDNFQKIQVVFLTINKTGTNQYEVTGKSKAYDNICGFTGIIEAQSFTIHEEGEYDEKLKNSPDGLPLDVTVTGKFRFEEDRNQSSTGIFEGTFRSSEYPPYNLTIFEGTWKSNTSGSTYKVGWANDARWSGFPFGHSPEGVLQPPEEYRSRGWGLEIDFYPVYAEQSRLDEYYELQFNWWK